MALLFLSNCATAPITDSSWWGSEATDGAEEFHVLTAEHRHLSMEEVMMLWNDLSRPVVCTYADTFADWKATIEKLCSYSGDCTFEGQQKAAIFFHKIMNRGK
jgi:hypothetical protein